MNAKEFLKQSKNYVNQMNDIKNKMVVVGILANSKTNKVYKNNQDVVSVGAIHEFGTKTIPQRSFLRVPFDINKEDIQKTINDQLKLVVGKDKDVTKALNVVGIKATNVSKKAFTTKGYGTWKELSPITIKLKGSSQILIDKGILRNSIAWEVRNSVT